MSHDVVFNPLAEQDLDRIDDFIALDNPSAATAFVARIEEQCAKLSTFPERGRLRPELGPEIRTLAVPRRSVIVYRIEGPSVLILRILYGGRDIESEMRDEAPDE